MVLLLLHLSIFQSLLLLQSLLHILLLGLMVYDILNFLIF
jgi:hypothetical protein